MEDEQPIDASLPIASAASSTSAEAMEMAHSFVRWYYPLINGILLMSDDCCDSDFGPQHFWVDASAQVKSRSFRTSEYEFENFRTRTRTHSFVRWYYPLINGILLMSDDCCDSVFGPQHFWVDASAQVKSRAFRTSEYESENFGL
jgi:hypothetical protein